MKNICVKCNRKGKCFFQANDLVCKKLLEKIRNKNKGK